MNKKGYTIIESLLALLLVVLVVLTVISYGPKMWDLIKTSIELSKFDADKISNEKINYMQVSEAKGKLGAVYIARMEDPVSIKPKSPDYCMIGTSITNTGTTDWTESDKIKATLFCKHLKNQLKNEIIIQNYPAMNYPEFKDYIIGLKPGEQKTFIFGGRAPNHCLRSLEKYYIILYSNCEGKGTQYEPCDNFGSDPATSPKKLDTVEFICKIS